MAAFLTKLSAGLFHLAVRVKPGARSSAVCAPLTLTDDSIDVRIAAPPVEGKANAELVSFLEEEVAQQWRNIHTLKEEYLVGTSYFSLLHTGAEDSVKKEDRTGKFSKKKLSGCTSGATSEELVSLPKNCHVSVQLVKGSTSRNKTLLLEFPGSEALLVSLLEKAAS